MTASTEPQVQTCADCGNSTHKYGLDSTGLYHCYRCCAQRDLDDMRATGKAMLYLTLVDATPQHTRTTYLGSTQRKAAKLTNWPGSLTLDNVCIQYTRYGHYTPNAGYMPRSDVWFTFDGAWWHGVSYGNYTQLTHCRRTKQPAPDNTKGGYSTRLDITDGYQG